MAAALVHPVARSSLWSSARGRRKLSSCRRQIQLARRRRCGTLRAILPAVRVLPHRRGFFWRGRAAYVSGSSPPRVVVFLDYQNVYHRAREAFFAAGAAARMGQVDPLALGHLLARRLPGGHLAGVRVYRGRPSRRRDPRSYAAFRRQIARQTSCGAGLVTVLSRDLRYPVEWPRLPAQEKGIDVALAIDLVLSVVRHECDVSIVFSSDTDLVPALEASIALRPDGAASVAVAVWMVPGVRPKVLSVRRERLPVHLLSAEDFHTVADLTDYTRR